MDVPQGISLADRFAAAGLTHEQLWMGYVAMGGLASPLKLEAYIEGALQPDRYQHDRIAAALNQHFLAGGGNHPVGYFEDVPPAEVS